MISLIPNNYFEMKNIFWIIAAAFAFVACSDDDGPREKPFDGEVVSFEASEHLLDAMTGGDVKLGPVTMSLMGMGDYTYANAFCAKQYAVEADFDGMLFSTADQNLIFNAYYSSLYDGWGGIGLSQMPDRNAAAPSSKQQFSVWAEGGANATETYAVFYDSNSPTEMYPEYLSESAIRPSTWWNRASSPTYTSPIRPGYTIISRGRIPTVFR